jgi:predicted nicotinamide N-methyase
LPRTDRQHPDLETLRDHLRHLGELRDEQVAIPGTGQCQTILRPVETDQLLDLAAADPEQNLPYWAELWPSGIALAGAIAAKPSRMRGQRVLELGCGLGVTAMAALAAGADLTVTDYAPDALALAAFNCQRQTGYVPAMAQVNWRSPDSAFARLIAGGFPVVLAADVLYETRDVAPLVALASRIVAPGGLLWLAEPGRRPAQAFLDAMRAAGWREESTHWEGPWPDPKDEEVVVTVHELRRPLDKRGGTGQ